MSKSLPTPIIVRKVPKVHTTWGRKSSPHSKSACRRGSTGTGPGDACETRRQLLLLLKNVVSADLVIPSFQLERQADSAGQGRTSSLSPTAGAQPYPALLCAWSPSPFAPSRLCVIHTFGRLRARRAGRRARAKTQSRKEKSCSRGEPKAGFPSPESARSVTREPRTWKRVLVKARRDLPT